MSQSVNSRPTNPIGSWNIGKISYNWNELFKEYKIENDYEKFFWKESISYFANSVNLNLTADNKVYINTLNEAYTGEWQWSNYENDRIFIIINISNSKVLFYGKYDKEHDLFNLYTQNIKMNKLEKFVNSQLYIERIKL